MNKKNYDILKIIPILFIVASIYIIGYNSVNKYQLPYNPNEENYWERNGVTPPVDVRKIVNINSADVKELMTIPGVEENVAENIVKRRQKLGKFKSLEELMFIDGISKKDLFYMLDYLTY